MKKIRFRIAIDPKLKTRLHWKCETCGEDIGSYFGDRSEKMFMKDHAKHVHGARADIR